MPLPPAGPSTLSKNRLCFDKCCSDCLLRRICGGVEPRTFPFKSRESIYFKILRFIVLRLMQFQDSRERQAIQSRPYYVPPPTDLRSGPTSSRYAGNLDPLEPINGSAPPIAPVRLSRPREMVSYLSSPQTRKLTGQY